MSRFIRSLIVILGLAAAGATSSFAQPAQVPPPSPREAIEKGRETAAERARAMAPELKALRDEMASQVGEVRALIEKKVDEAGARAVTYTLWAAVGFFALMVLASVLGGVIVALLFRRTRA